MAASNLFDNSMATSYDEYQRPMNITGQLGQAQVAQNSGPWGQNYWQKQAEKAKYERMLYEAHIHKDNHLELKQRAIEVAEIVRTTKRRKAILLLLKGV